VCTAALLRVRIADDAVRWSYVAWSFVFAFLTALLLLRHGVGVDPELIALASAGWLFVVLVVASSCACHTILHAADQWADHLFVACTAFWWMFHDPVNPWVGRSGRWPLAPSLLMVAVRVADAIDGGRCRPIELVGWILLTGVDIVWTSGNLSAPWFFAIYAFVMIANIVVLTSFAATGRLFCLPCAVPFFVGYGCALSCTYGPQRAVDRVTTRVDEMINELEPDVHDLMHDLGLPEI
jgi:hypothetical protein